MSEVALLNPQADLEGAKRLLQIVEAKLHGMENAMLQTQVDHEIYLTKFGGIQALRDVYAKLEREYQGMVNK